MARVCALYAHVAFELCSGMATYFSVMCVVGMSPKWPQLRLLIVGVGMCFYTVTPARLNTPVASRLSSPVCKVCQAQGPCQVS